MSNVHRYLGLIINVLLFLTFSLKRHIWYNLSGSVPSHYELIYFPIYLTLFIWIKKFSWQQSLCCRVLSTYEIINKKVIIFLFSREIVLSSIFKLFYLIILVKPVVSLIKDSNRLPMISNLSPCTIYYMSYFIGPYKL